MNLIEIILCVSLSINVGIGTAFILPYIADKIEQRKNHKANKA
jgi:hypothetical protein